jgi:hypothetical protein
MWRPGEATSGQIDPPGTPPTTGTVVAGRYELVALRSRRGVLACWEAIDPVLARHVAVAVVAGESDATEVRHTAVAAGRLVHEAVAAVYDTGGDDERAWVVTELVPGPSIADRVAQHGPLPVAAAVSMTARVLDGLTHAHRIGLAHGQLDAASVSGPAGAEKITGYGLPPVGHGSPVDDIHAAGVLLTTALTGAPPPDDRPRGWLRRARPGIPAPLDDIVTRALDGSWPSADDMATALRDLGLGRDDAIPLVAGDSTPPSGVRTIPRRPPRRPLLPILVTVLVLVASAVVAVGLADRGPTRRGGPGPTGSPIAIAQVTTFDPPPGDGHERDSRVNAVVDGDPASAWASEGYRSASLGGLKSGVGLVVRLASATTVRAVTVDSPTNGWQAAVYTGDGRATTLAGWGSPVATTEVVDGSATISLQEVRAAALLVWFTRLGPDGGRFTISIANLVVT